MFMAALFIEAKKMDGWMGKQNVVYTYNRILA